jgi:hypothetical protein
VASAKSVESAKSVSHVASAQSAASVQREAKGRTVRTVQIAIHARVVTMTVAADETAEADSVTVTVVAVAMDRMSLSRR